MVVMPTTRIRREKEKIAATTREVIQLKNASEGGGI
jgi:hypothetical protein